MHGRNTTQVHPSGPARRRSGRTAAAGALLGVVVSAALVLSVVRYAAQNPEKANLGDRVFEVGSAERLAREVDDRGPFLFQDPLSRGRGRNLYMQHLGGDPDKGWLAVEARLPGQPGCTVTWDRARATFVDCHGTTHPEDGSGLTTYPATVEHGVVSVDLRRR